MDPSANELTGGATFAGVRILVVEDHFLLADDLSRTLRAFGAEVIGPVATVAAAITHLKEQPDLVMLDIDLDGEKADPVANELIRRKIPWVLVTGYEPDTLPERYSDVTRVEKPFSSATVLVALNQALGHRRDG